MKIKLKFKFGDIIKHKLDYEGVDVYMVVSVQISYDKKIAYGCSDIKGEWKWLKDFEMELVKNKGKEIGFDLTLSTNGQV